MTSFTPGPWIWRWKSCSLHRPGEPPYPYGKSVLTPTYDYDAGIEFEVSEADAALIEAAPELYEALKTITSVLKEWVEEYGETPGEHELQQIAEAEAALAKAAGS